MPLLLGVLSCSSSSDRSPAASGSTSSLTTTREETFAIGFKTLPEGFATSGTHDTMAFFNANGGGDLGKATVQAGVRSSSSDMGITVSLFAGKADLLDGFADDAERSGARDGAVVKRLEGSMWIMWAEQGALVVATAPTQVPLTTLTEVVKAVKITAD